MKIVRLFVHLFLPHESNNQKAKILHNSSLTLIILGLLFYQLVLSAIPRIGPRILGFAANIPPDEVIRLTNEKRAQNGLAPVSSNSLLSQAAQAKGADMLNKGYWAHVSPDGVQPWFFFTNAGYKYRYAGENLARDFSNASSAVDAWMNSPSHRENMLNPRYKDIGVAVVEGKLAGVDTTIIVQFFGATFTDTVPALPVAKAQTVIRLSPTPSPTASPLALTSATPQALVGSEGTQELSVRPYTLISPFTTTKGVSLAVVLILLVVLVLDAFITSRRAVVRIGGRTFAHLAFLGMIAAVILILKAGRII